MPTLTTHCQPSVGRSEEEDEFNNFFSLADEAGCHTTEKKILKFQDFVFFLVYLSDTCY